MPINRNAFETKSLQPGVLLLQGVLSGVGAGLAPVSSHPFVTVERTGLGTYDLSLPGVGSLNILEVTFSDRLNLTTAPAPLATETLAYQQVTRVSAISDTTVSIRTALPIPGLDVQTYRKDSADASDGAVTAEFAAFRSPGECFINGLSFMPDANASGAGSANFRLREYSFSGAFVKELTPAGGTALTAAQVLQWNKEDISLDFAGLPASLITTLNSTLTLEIEKNGGGITLPSGTFVLDYAGYRATDMIQGNEASFTIAVKNSSA